MQRLPGPYRVYVGLVPTGYLNGENIAQVIREGIAFCGMSGRLSKLKPSSKIVLRTDVPAAHPKIGKYAYTHPEVARGSISQLLTLAPGARLHVVEKSA